MHKLTLTFAACAQLLLFSAPGEAQTLACVNAGAAGVIPTSGSGGGLYPFGPLPSAPTQIPINVSALPPGANFVTEVRVLGLVHSWVSDLQFVLTDPSGASHNLFCRMSASNGASFGCDYSGDYTIVPQCTAPVSLPPSFCSGSVIFPPGVYDQLFGRGGQAWPSGTSGIFNTRLDAIPAALGVWTLSVYDWSPGDTGVVADVQLCFGAPTAPTASPSTAPSLSTPEPLANVFGPNVRLVWSATPCAASYDVEVDGVLSSSSVNALTYVSSPGAHNWRVRARNSLGAGPWSTLRTFTDLGPAPTPCTGPSLATLFASNTTQAAGGAVFFDVDVLAPSGIRLSEIELNTTAAVPSALSLEVYTRSGSYVGFEQSSAGWTLATSGSGVAQGANTPSRIDVNDVVLAPGVTGVCLALSGGAQALSVFNPLAGATYSDAQLAITAGAAQPALFASAPIVGRIWNGRLRYNCGAAPPTNFCTAGVSTNGCTPTLSASAQPSASLTTPCVISASGLEGQKQGLIFYGTDNSNFAPLAWGAGTSLLCVKPPTQRTGVIGAGGALNACDGALALNWNSFASANPSALGAPFAAGAKLFAQAWYRDPPAPKSTNLSDALELTFLP